MTVLVASMAAERTAMLTRPCLIDPKLLALLRNFLGQSKEPVILGTVECGNERSQPAAQSQAS
jgi:hypothetical protein